MKNKREIIFTLVGVAFLVFVFVSMGVFRNLGKQVATDFYVNAKGQKWVLPTESTYEFTANASGYPRFLGGTIEPLKVKVGDVQTMRVRVASPVLIEKVIASIETDTKMQEIQLSVKESKTLSAEYFENQPYLIDDGELIINKAGSSYAEKAIKQLVASAEAQSLVEYVFEGSWAVNDTHTKTYHTKFTATDKDGNEVKMVLMWSDPVCVFNEKGELQSEGCTVNGGVEGFDGGNLTIFDGQTITLNGTSTLVWNGDAEDNRSLIIKDGGSIVLEVVESQTERPQIKESMLFYRDIDSDTFTDDLASIHYECLDQCEGEIRVKLSPSRPWSGLTLTNDGLDCADDIANTPQAPDVHPQIPGYERYFKEPIENPPSGLSYDYNCDGNQDGGWGDNIPANTTSTATVYFETISGGYDSGGGEQACIVGLSLADFTPYCGTLSPASIDHCDIGEISGPPSGTSEIFPQPLDNGYMYGECTGCIGQSLAGFCR